MFEHVLAIILLVISLVTAALLVHVFRNLWRERFSVVFVDPTRVLFKKDCKSCSGGVQALVEGKWGPVPEHWKMEQREGGNRGWFSSPVANRRRCKECNGLGFHITGKDEVDLPYPRP
jgi:hypothetical protein